MTIPDRERILEVIITPLRDRESVIAVWEGGSTALDRSDRHSDIDLYIMVEPGRTGSTIDCVESSLESLTGIDLRYESQGSHWPGVRQVFYRLKGISPLLLVDMAVIEKGCSESFLEVEVHGRARPFIWRKDEGLPHIDTPTLIGRVSETLLTTRVRFDMFSPFLGKEMSRGHLIDAIDTYLKVHVATLVRLLRIRHCPPRFDFGAIRIDQDIPQEDAIRLESLFLIDGMEDLERKSRAAERWIGELNAEIESIGIETLVKGYLSSR